MSIKDAISIVGPSVLTGASTYRQAMGGFAVAGVSLLTGLVLYKFEHMERDFLKYLNLPVKSKHQFTIDASSSAMAPCLTMAIVKLVMRILGRPYLIPTNVLALAAIGFVAFAILAVKLHRRKDAEAIKAALTEIKPVPFPTSFHEISSDKDLQDRYPIRDSLEYRVRTFLSDLSFNKCKTYTLSRSTLTMNVGEYSMWVEKERTDYIFIKKSGEREYSPVKPGARPLDGLYNALQELYPSNIEEPIRKQLNDIILQQILPYRVDSFLSEKVQTFLEQRLEDVANVELVLVLGDVDFKVVDGKIRITLQYWFRKQSDSLPIVEFSIQHNIGMDAKSLETFLCMPPE
jgi:hypothetical protein